MEGGGDIEEGMPGKEIWGEQERGAGKGMKDEWWVFAPLAAFMAWR